MSRRTDEPGWRVTLFRMLSQPIVTTFFGAVVDHVDLALMKTTNGRFSITAWITGWPVVTLTTIGAHSGQPRQTPLIGIPQEDRFILIASNFGRPKHPAWYHNLKKHPSVELFLNGHSATYIAREAQGDERQRYWQLAAQVNPGFDAYAARAIGRTIPVIILDPDW